jgi:hypothetical protein
MDERIRSVWLQLPRPGRQQRRRAYVKSNLAHHRAFLSVLALLFSVTLAPEARAIPPPRRLPLGM